MTNLFEYKNSEDFNTSKFNDLECFLDDVWSKREKSYYYTEEENRIETQRFIQFFHKNKTLKSNKYVGVIHFEGETINLLPKIFYDDKTPTQHEINAINKHIFWWLSYCRKLKFPNYLSGLSSESSDIFEILIYLFSKYTRALLNSSIYQQYSNVNRELNFVKGRIDFNNYINNNLSKGKNHKISCEFDSFELDNDFNRGVKYVAKILLNTTNQNQNKRFLNDILFILDEVSDVTISSDLMKRMSFNPMFSDFETVRDYCVLFLENSISFNYKSSLKLFAFLLPMEYVFEDFIFGFIDKEIDEITAKAQDGSKYLDTKKHFKLKPDLFLKIGDRKIISDTKYKITYANDNDPKKGISQTDLYQMLAYALRFEVENIILYYPNTIKNSSLKINNSELRIVDELADGKEINIKSFQLPIINFHLFNDSYVSAFSLKDEFNSTKDNLIKALLKSIQL